MKKRLLAILCMLIILVGVFAFNAVADTATNKYQVGYSIKDINPWVDPSNHSLGLLNTIQLTGNGNDSERNITGLMDDNDDGAVGEGDGLHAVCTAVTDPYGTTVLYITLDSIAGYGGVTTKLRETIIEALGSDVIKEDQIFVNGSHTHSGVNLENLDGKDGGRDEYYDYVINQITASAVEAYNDRAPATMKKGSIDAKESTANKGYNSGNGYNMNAIRHYNMAVKKGSTTKQYVAGSNFGKHASVGVSLTIGGVSGYTVTANSNVAEADNTMHVLMFDFGTSSSKKPILLVNWRAHTTNNSGGTNKTFASSDYVNSLRANLKKAGYRAAFLQGAAGNVVMHSSYGSDWILHTGELDSNVYGRLLAEIAVDCVTNKMTTAAVGKIRTMRLNYVGEKQQPSEGLLAAAEQFTAEAADGTAPGTPYVYTYPKDGKKYILNSAFHANSIIYRNNTTYNSVLELELNAIMIGSNVAFVTAPNEIVDRYDINGSRVDADNDWLELVSTNLLGKSTYGTPFVMGYTNGSKGYIPNALDYTYNTDEYYNITGWGANGDEFFGAGSYEANVSRFARGTGEDIVQTYKSMLKAMDSGYRTAKCEACGTQVEWQPLVAGQSANQYLGTGHYYLTEDLPVNDYSRNQKMILDGETLCLDLYGHKYEAEGRSFNLESGATLNVMDSKGSGQVISYSGGNNVGGGVVALAEGATMNIYGGTLQFVRQELPEDKYETGIGGVINCFGTVNMYGGTLIGGELAESGYTTAANNGCGATICLNGKGRLNLAGGQVIAGKAAPGKKGNCVYLTGTNCTVTLSGNASVDEIYVDELAVNQLTVKDNYTGKTALYFNPKNITLYKNAVIGQSNNAAFTQDNLYCTSHSQFRVGLLGSNLILGTRYATITAPCQACNNQAVQWKPLAIESAGSQFLGTGHYYLVENLPAGDYAKNQKVIYDGQTLCLDLHGHKSEIKGRSFYVHAGGTLNLLDTVGGGKVISYSGGNNVTGGTVMVDGGTMNIYGGILEYGRLELPEGVGNNTRNGSIIACKGVVNMYGGTLRGGIIAEYNASNTESGCGGTVYLYEAGQLNLSGGKILAGKAAENCRGDCIYLSGTSCAVTLSGDAAVDEIYINENSGTQLNIKGNFTGTTSVVFNPDKNTLSKGADVGNILDSGTFASNALLTPDFTRMKIVANADNLVLGELYDVITAPCRACGGSDKEWIPLTIERAGENYLGTGHYYLPEDLPAGDYGKNQKILKAGETLCLDLHGHKSEIQGRSFYVNTGSTLNVMDTVGGGEVISYSGGNNVGGGTAFVDVNAVMNIYGGTFRFVRQELPAGKGNVSKGAVISCCGTVNMYDGTLIGGTIQDFNLTDAETGCGGTVYLYSSGKLNLSGGEIVAGKAASGRWGDCVYLSGKNCTVTLSGAGKADEIYINENSGTQLVVSGTYTGKAKVHFNQNEIILTKGVDVGAVTENAVFDHTNLYCTSHSQFQLAASETDLVLTSWDSTVAAVVAGDDFCTTYTTLADALQNYTSGSIVLTKDVEESVAITKNVYMDLNGCDINGALTISEGKTLYCMDSQTDDYTVADGVYGTISNYTGTLTGVQEGWDRVPDGYLMVTEGGKTSFHRVNLQLTTMSLRASEVGVYYRSNFAGDEVVARNVQTFGVALSTQSVPTQDNLDSHCLRSKFRGFDSGATGNSDDSTSTLLKNVMKTGNTDATNIRNASLNIYGRAYVCTTNGQYLFGKAASRTFREQVEAVNDIWSTLSDSQKAAATNLVKTYPNVVASWDIPNILG